VTSRSAAVNARSNSSRVLAFVARSAVLIFDHINSMGEKSGERLGDDKLRRGKVVLLFTTTDCRYCDDENNFLKTVAGTRKDVSYYFVIPFGMKEQMLREAQRKYAFETFYDEGSMLSRSLQIYQGALAGLS
jgi:hypothetical protein